MIHADFDSILVPEHNGKQNPHESFTSKYQKHGACGYVSKLMCIDDKFSKPFKWYLGENSVYNVISSLIKKSKYCRDAMKNISTENNKELVMTKLHNEHIENSTNVGFLIMIMLMVMLK